MISLFPIEIFLKEQSNRKYVSKCKTVSMSVEHCTIQLVVLLIKLLSVCLDHHAVPTLRYLDHFHFCLSVWYLIRSASRGPQRKTTKMLEDRQCPVCFLWALGFCLPCLMPLGCAAHCLLTWLGYTDWIVSWPKLTPKSLSAACCALCPVRTVEHINLLNSSINPASYAFPLRCSWEMVSRLLLPLSCHQVTGAVSELGPWLQ